MASEIKHESRTDTLGFGFLLKPEGKEAVIPTYSFYLLTLNLWHVWYLLDLGLFLSLNLTA